MRNFTDLMHDVFRISRSVADLNTDLVLARYELAELRRAADIRRKQS